jgi:cystathionine beta-lyase/cystathionine gamma-synthase
MSAEELSRYGVGDDLVRISVGIEHWRDLLAEFQAALDGA